MSSSAGPTDRSDDGYDTGRDTGRDTGTGTGRTHDDVDRPRVSRREVVARQKEEHGGVKIGSAFFGFLTATGVGVLLTALLAAAGTAVGLSNGVTAQDATSATSSDASTIGIVGGILLLVVLFVAYYCGGYVASRMARFNGIKQGIAVWVWALVVAVVVAILAAVAGDKYNILGQLNGFPRIPVNEGDLTTGGIIAAVAVVLASLVGAILGGLAGMRFHRKVDRTGLGR
jgi:amino acid transporter